MNKTRTRVLTGLQPSGTLHLGNYFGSMRPMLELTHEPDADVFLMVADYHALTSVRDGAALRRMIMENVRDYLAAGFDPKQITLFRQSDNPDHLELAWVFNCLVSVPFLKQAHAYKDKVAKGLEPSAGLFTYPMLMAADIVLYDTDVVPVGEDQRQHVEYAREAVTKFNLTYGPQLKEPRERIVEGVGVVPGTDGQKMSKSYQNTIPLFGSTEEIQKAVMRIVTDSEGTHPENVYAIHQLFKSEAELTPLYEQNQGKYKVLKDALAADIETFVAPLRERRAAIRDADIRSALEQGVERARAVSRDTLRRVRDAVGISLS